MERHTRGGRGRGRERGEEYVYSKKQIKELVYTILLLQMRPRFLKHLTCECATASKPSDQRCPSRSAFTRVLLARPGVSTVVNVISTRDY